MRRKKKKKLVGRLAYTKLFRSDQQKKKKKMKTAPQQLVRRKALPAGSPAPLRPSLPRAGVSAASPDAPQHRRRRRIERRRANAAAAAKASGSSIDDDDFASAFSASSSSPSLARLELPAVVCRLVAGADTKEQVSSAVARGATAIWLCAGAGEFFWGEEEIDWKSEKKRIAGATPPPSSF